MERWNPYVTELMLFPNSNTLLCQAKELCWPRGQGPPLSLAGRARELRADMKLLASEGGEKVWVATSAKEQGEETVGPRQCRLRAVLQLQGAIVKEALPMQGGGWGEGYCGGRGRRRMAGGGWKHGGSQGSISAVNFSSYCPCVSTLGSWEEPVPGGLRSR